jgi:hypothetical protein
MKYAKIEVKTVGGSPTAITNDLPGVVCWVSQMASSFISHFFLRRQEKVTKKKVTPVCRPCGVPSISRKQAGLRNSTWRGAHPAPHGGTRTKRRLRHNPKVSLPYEIKNSKLVAASFTN